MMNQEQQTSQVAGQRIRVQSYLYLQCWHQIDFPVCLIWGLFCVCTSDGLCEGFKIKK